MGEINKILGEMKLSSGEKFAIELNDPCRKGLPKTIHIQSDKFRLEVSEREFRKLAAAILFANSTLTSSKS